MDDTSLMPPGRSAAQDDISCPLFVDLDGTLVAGDTLMDSLTLMIRNGPSNLFRLPLWYLDGLPEFKRHVAQTTELDPAALPYRPNLLQFLNEQKQRGRRLILATASDQRVANAVATHLGIFDDVIATNGIEGNPSNLRSDAKLGAIRDLLNGGEFDYVGDSRQDLPVWAAAKRAYLVAPAPSVLNKARALGNVAEVFNPRPAGATLRAIVRAIRPHQWLKNLLLAVPMILGQELAASGKWLALVLAIVAFSLCASAMYVLNDVLDVPADRRHPTKRNRPFAAGILSARLGVTMALILAGVGILLALVISAGFLAVLAVYVVAATVYSMGAKGQPIIDVLLLAGLYTLRIVAGGAATEVEVSPWLLAFSMFIFLSIAFAKRHAELTLIGTDGQDKAPGRGYVVEDLPLIANVGTTSGYLAVLVFALYIHNSKTVSQLYERQEVLWLICPLLLYWFTRLWFKAHRKRLVDDPLQFATTDWVTYLVGILIVIIALAAKI